MLFSHKNIQRNHGNLVILKLCERKWKISWHSSLNMIIFVKLPWEQRYGWKLFMLCISVFFFFSMFLLRTPFQPCTCRYVFSLYSPPPSTSVRMFFFQRRCDRDNFCELLSIKELQTTLQMKNKLLFKAIGKMLRFLTVLGR